MFTYCPRDDKKITNLLLTVPMRSNKVKNKGNAVSEKGRGIPKLLQLI